MILGPPSYPFVIGEPDACYRPSGRASRAALPVVIACALAAAPAAWLYAWLAVRTPLAAHCVFSALFAAWLAWLGRQAAALGKVRSPERMARLGTAIGVAGLYAHWAAWLALTGYTAHATVPHGSPTEQVLAMLLHPGAVLVGAVDVARHDRIVPAVFWLGEAFLLCLAPRLTGRRRAGDPFCETTNSWAEAVDVPHRFAPIHDALAARRFLADYPQHLGTLLAPWSEAAGPQHAHATIHRCRGGAVYLSLYDVSFTYYDDGKARKSELQVTRHAGMKGFDLERLQRTLAQAARSPAAIKDHADTARTPPELAGALADVEAGRVDAALAAAKTYIDAEDPVLRAAALRLCADACARLERWRDALGYWRALFALEPGARYALQVACGFVMAGDEPGHGAFWVQRARLLNGSAPQVPPATLLASYLAALTRAGRTRDALHWLELIREDYRVIGRDPARLFAHSLPPLDVFLEHSEPVVRASLDPSRARAWYECLDSDLDLTGIPELTAFLAARFPRA